MRTVLIAAIAAAAPLTAWALPHAMVDASPGTELVQNRFLPGFLGGGGGDRNNETDAALRLQQLEAQVRMLTGQVEELTFTVRRLEALMGQRPVGDQRGALATPGAVPGPGAPPGILGTIPATPGTPAAPTQQPNAVASAPPAAGGGPIDLSVLNQGAGGGAFGAPAASPAPAAPAPQPQQATAPATGGGLSKVRELHASGRYSMAASEARTVLSTNPNGEVAGEARFLLGEALLAQGDYRGAANQFLENYTSDPNGAHAPQSLLRLGTSLNGLGEREAACSSLEELFGAYPNVSAEVRAAAEQERKAANCA